MRHGIAATALCGVVLLAGCGHRVIPSVATPTATTTVQPSQAPIASASLGTGVAASASPQGLRLHMLSTATGWLFSDGTVSYTSDGGKVWRVARPPDLSQHDRIIAEGFSSRMTSLVVSGATTRVYTTTDNGFHWVSTPIADDLPSGSAVSIDYVGQDGWIMFVSNMAMGAQEDVIYHTVDGGAHWIQVSSSMWSTQSTNAILPRGAKTGLAFVSSLDGWATISNDTWQGHAEIYATADGGATWHDQSLEVPPAFATFTSTTLPPTLFTSRDGILPVIFESIDGETRELVLYRTDDGGANWSPGSAIPVVESLAFPLGDPTAILATAAPNNAWVWDGTRLQVTHNEGVSWHPLTPNVSMDGVDQLDFVTSTTGFALFGAMPSGWRILRTGDGGDTWSSVAD